MRSFGITCDWLQVYCSNQNKPELNLNTLDSNTYTFVKEEMSSRQFKDIYNVYDCNKDHYANIQCTPFSSIIDASGCIIKLSNRELYKCDWAARLIQFLKRHNFIYKSISRIDVCYDFNTFCHGMKPRRLINSFLAKRFLKNGQGNYQLIGSTSLINDYSYIRFGKRSSAVCSYMYDKTKELREVKDKPYIREFWKLNGIDDSKEVWRVEISIKSDMQNLVCLENGDVFRLSMNELQTQKDIESIFYIYASKYFNFKVNDGTKNKTRMKDVRLFDRIDSVSRRPIRLTLASDSNRADRIFLKKLEKIKTELRDVDKDLKKAINRVQLEFSIQKKLSSYFIEKVIPDKRERQ